MLNKFQFNTSRYNETATSVIESLSNPTLERYTLTVNDPDDKLLAFLPSYYNATSKESVNQIGTLTFSYPALNTETNYLTFPNRIVLRDLFGNVIEKFHIMQTEFIQSTEGNYYVNVECESLITQLSNELITFDTSSSTIISILTDWFKNKQVNSKKILLGEIETSIKNQVRSIKLQQESILEGIKQLSETLDDKVFWVDPVTRKFNWKTKRESYQGKHISLGYNLSGIKKRVDYSSIANRIYVYSEDDVDYKKSLIWAGESNEYIQNNDSINLYGIRNKKFILKNIEYPQQMIDFANQALRNYSEPKVSYEIDTLDLFQSNATNNDFLKMKAGYEIRLNHYEYDIEVKNLILSVTRNLDSPLDIKIVFAERMPDIEDVFESLNRRIKNEENSPSPSTKNIVDSLDQVVDNTGNESHVKLVELIQDAVTKGLDNPSDPLSRQELINEIIEAITEQLNNYAGETITQNLVEEIVQSIINNSTFAETLNGAFVPYYKATTFAGLSNYDIESYALGFVEGTDSDDGKLYKRNAANDNWEEIGSQLKSAANVSALDAILTEGELGFTTESHTPLYWKAEDTLICLSHLG